MANGLNIFGRPQEQGLFGFGNQGATSSTIGQLLPIGLGFAAGGPVGGIFGSFLSDVFRSNQRNQRAEDLLAQTTGFAQGGEVAPGAPPVSIGAQNEDVESVLDPFQPTFIGPGNQVFGVGAADPVFARIGSRTGESIIDEAIANFDGPIIDLRNVNPARVQLDALAELGLTPESVQVGTGFLDRGRERIGSLFDEARAEIDTDLSDVLAADLLGIGEASRARQQAAQNRLAAQASRFGGLEQVQDAASTIVDEEAIDRAGLAQGARGRTRLQELAAQQFVANLFGQQAGVEAGLLPVEAGVLEGDVARSTAVAQFLSELEKNADPATNQFLLDQFITSQLANQGNQALSREGLENQLTTLFTQIMSPQTELNDILTTSFLPTLFPNQFIPDTGGGGFDFGGMLNIDPFDLLSLGGEG